MREEKRTKAVKRMGMMARRRPGGQCAVEKSDSVESRRCSGQRDNADASRETPANRHHMGVMVTRDVRLIGPVAISPRVIASELVKLAVEP